MAMIVVGILDPIRLILVLAIVAMWRSPWAILVATLVSALVSETLLTAIQVTRVWGYGIAPGLVASLVQAVVVYGLFKLWRGRKDKANSAP